MLRPREWIEARLAAPGPTIRLDVGELGEQVAAEVRAIGPCPPIQPGRGSVVTATFCHEIDPGTRVLSLSVAGAERPTGVTDNHPLWSASRGEFVPAGQLRVGELVDTRAGPRPITAITPRPYTDRLYNLETIEHVYRVGLAGTLVHNNGGANACGPGMAAATITVPNPGGRLGNAATRAKTQDVIQDLQSRGFIDFDTEVPFRPGSLGSGKKRFADVVGRNPITGETEIVQIGRTIKSDPRIPIIRERHALDDIIFSPDIQKYPNTTIRFVDVNRPGVIQP